MKSGTARRHRAAAPILVTLVLALIGGIYAAVNATTASADDAVASQEQIATGKKLFEQGCSSCHGMGAVGTKDAPSLVGAGAASVDFQVSTGRMPLAQNQAEAPEKPVAYNDEQIAALAAYIGSLGPGPSIPTAQDLDYTNADLAFGGQLFRTNCSQCHNFAGSGGALSNGAYGPNIRSASAKEIYEAMLTGPENMPVFSNASMSPAEKQAVIQYVMHLRTEPSYGGWGLGRFGPVTEGLFVWAGALVLFIAGAVWIGAKVR